MLIDCHLHTSRYSPCSLMDPVSACKTALAKGLQGLVITEHQRQWPSDEIRDLQQRFPELALFTGLEVTLKNGVDVVIITEKQGLSLPLGSSLQSLLDQGRVDPEKSFLFPAHLFRWSSAQPRGMQEMAPWIHGLEMASVNILKGQYVRQGSGFRPTRQSLYEKTRDSFGLQGIYNSDAHETAAVGSLANKISCRRTPRSEPELAECLKQTIIEEHQDPALLAPLLGE